MLFNSPAFLFLFLPVVLAGFHAAGRLGGRKGAIVWLLVASLVFYANWQVSDLWIFGLSIAMNFALGWLLRRRPSGGLLAVGIALNLVVLAYFKYFYFLGLQGVIRNEAFWPNAAVIPLAISFFTFQQIAYLVDVRRGEAARYGFLDYSAFVSFFPHLIAGPIVRHSELLPQFARFLPRLQAGHAAVGITFLAIGLFKKTVIADGLALTASPIFDAAAAGRPIGATAAWIGVLAYTLQLYFDFSGYTDMAIGLARMFGFRLPPNFDSPYQAASIVDFWRRWHMTLSRFLRDYLYIPLGGNRVSPVRRVRNVAVVMLLGGLWHGAEWTFIVWGGLHAIYILINHAWRALLARLRWQQGSFGRPGRVLAWALTFIAVTVAWIFFRASSLGAAIHLLHAMAAVAPSAAPDAKVAAAAFDLNRLLLLGFAFTLAVACPNSQQIMARWRPLLRPPLPPAAFWHWLSWRPTAPFAAMTALALAAVVSRLWAPSEFLYFRF